MRVMSRADVCPYKWDSPLDPHTPLTVPFFPPNPDSILKSKDITLPTVVKAMVFPVVMYGCETWSIKKAEC